MPVIATLGGITGWGRQNVAVAAPSPIVAGNATTTMDSTGATAIPGVAGQDDTFGPIPTESSFVFNFFGTNYGSGAAAPNGMYWNTNNVLGFGQGNGVITWAANTGKGILIGNADRRTNTGYYFPITTSGAYRILRILISFQNLYNDGVANAGQMAIRMVKDTISGNQYIEFRIFRGSPSVNGGTISNTGQWNITNGTAFQSTSGQTYSTAFSGGFPAGNTSFVLSSDSTGSAWVFQNTAYLNI